MMRDVGSEPTIEINVVAVQDVVKEIEAAISVGVEDEQMQDLLSRLEAVSSARREPAQLALPLPEQGIFELIRDRAELWASRSYKWHRILNRERAWTWRGVALPGLVGALCALAVVLDALKVIHVPIAAAWPAIGTVVTALISLRANQARVKLDVGNVEQVWVVADRMAEHYRGLVVQCGSLSAELDSIFHESQRLEAAARFGLPSAFAEAIKDVTRPLKMKCGDE